VLSRNESSGVNPRLSGFARMSFDSSVSGEV
jgi:hypothetical protein